MSFALATQLPSWTEALRSRVTTAALASVIALGTLATSGCRSDGQGAGPPIPASSAPEGTDLVEGAIVVAVDEKRKTVRIYKLIQVNYFPPPVGDELVMIAYNEMGSDFRHASDLWQQRKLTVAIAKVRVQRQMFKARNYRVIANEPVSEADKKLKADDPIPQRQQ